MVISTAVLGVIVVSSCIKAFDDKKKVSITTMEQNEIHNDNIGGSVVCDTSEQEDDSDNKNTSTETSITTVTEDMPNHVVTSCDLDTDFEEYEIDEHSTTQLNSTYSGDYTTEIMTTVHSHTFVMTSSCMYHPEEGHYKEVCVAEGYTENIYEYYERYCYYCGVVMDDWGFEDILEHSSLHGAYGSYQQLTDSIWHEPVYESVWVVDVEEYYEEEMVVECIDCGYIERSKFYGD